MSLAGESDRNLGARLIASGRITSEQLAACLEQQRRAGGPERVGLAEILVRAGLLSSAELTRYGFASGAFSPAPDGPVRPRSPISSSALAPVELEHAIADPARRVGRYVVLRELGRGGMGAVYRGWDPELRREVAIKRLHELAGAGEAERLRLIQEARAAARLHHPGIVAVHEVGDHDGQPYLVMDYVAGRTLAAAGARRPLPARQAAAIVRDVAIALQHAHEQGVIHRDVKPHNVLLDERDRPRLVDFGLARVVDAQTHLTKTGQMVGTPQYVSPEQARGDLREVGPSTDIHSLGAVLYWALVGRPPFTGENLLEILKKLFMHEPDPPRSIDPTIHPDLETIVMRCLEKSPERRYASAGEVAGELARFLDGAAIEARPPGAARRARRWARRHRAAAAAIGVAVALVAAGIVAGVVVFIEVRRQVAADRAEVVARARADADATSAAFREARAQPAPETADGRRARSERLLALGLDAVQAAAARRLLDLDDEPARADAFAVTMAYGEVALEAEQWSLAETLFGKAAGLGVDEPRARRALAGVAAAREARAVERRAAVEAILADARGGELARRPGGYDDALFGLVRYADPQTVALVAAALDGVTETLHAATRDVYAKAARAGEGDGEIHGLDGAVERFLALAPGEALDEATRIVLARADRRLQTWDFERRPVEVHAKERAPRAIVADAQTAALGEAGALLARLCCDALARIGIRDGAVDAIARYLQAEAEERRAVHPGIALVRLGGPDGFELVDPARRRFGMDGAFWSRVSRWLTPESAAGVGDGAPSPASSGSGDEESAKAFFRTGLARITSGDFAGAVLAFGRAIELDPNDKASWGNRAAARLELGDPDGCIADLDRAIALDPRDPTSFRNRGVAKFRKRDLDAAIADFDRAIALDPRDAEAYCNRGGARQEKGDLAGAVADATRAIDVDPRRADAWGARGLFLSGLGRADEAIADLDRAIALDPENGRHHCHRGAALMKKKRHADAIAAFDRGLALDPSYATGWVNRGIARYETGDVDGAISDYGRALELEPRLRPAWVRRGTARVRNGDFRGGVSDFDRALAMDDRDAMTLSNRAFARYRLEDHDGAIEDATRAIALDPGDAGFWANRGIALIAKGRVDDAIADFDRALALEPRDGGLLTNRALAHEAAGHAEKAIADFERFLEITPDSPYQDRILEKIEELRKKG